MWKLLRRRLRRNHLDRSPADRFSANFSLCDNNDPNSHDTRHFVFIPNLAYIALTRVQWTVVEISSRNYSNSSRLQSARLHHQEMVCTMRKRTPRGALLSRQELSRTLRE